MNRVIVLGSIGLTLHSHNPTCIIARFKEYRIVPICFYSFNLVILCKKNTLNSKEVKALQNNICLLCLFNFL